MICTNVAPWCAELGAPVALPAEREGLRDLVCLVFLGLPVGRRAANGVSLEQSLLIRGLGSLQSACFIELSVLIRGLGSALVSLFSWSVCTSNILVNR